jgi:hypothetical protein
MSFTSVTTTEPYSDFYQSDDDLERDFMLLPAVRPARVCIKKRELINRGYKDFEEWKADPNHLYIGRNMNFYVKGTTASIYCNPYKLSEYSLEEALSLYKIHIESSEALMDNIHTVLEYEEIGCWCLPGERCHGDVLIDIALERVEQEENNV